MAKVKGASFSLGAFAKEYLEGKKNELGITMSEYVKCLVFKDMMAGGTSLEDIVKCNKALDIADISNDLHTGLDFYNKNVAKSEPLSPVSQSITLDTKVTSQDGMNVNTVSNPNDITNHITNNITNNQKQATPKAKDTDVTVNNTNNNINNITDTNIQQKKATFAMDAPIQSDSEML